MSRDKFVWADEDIEIVQHEETGDNSGTPVVSNMLPDNEKRTIENQQASLQNSIVNVQEELVLATISKVTGNAFEEQDEIVNKADREKAERDLAAVLSIFYNIILPMQGRAVINKRISEFGVMGTFTLTARVKDYIEEMSALAAASHTNTILEDLLTAARLATYIGGIEEIEKVILTTYPNANRERIAEVVRTAVVGNKTPEDIAAVIQSTYEKIKLEDIFAATREAALKGATQQELIQFIKAQYQKISTVRAKAIARSETERAFNRSQFEADFQFLKQNGLLGRAYKQWRTRSDNPCPFCIMKSQEAPIPFETPFGEVGDVWTATFEKADGTTSVRKLPITYETVQAGNGHVNCFCQYQLIII